MRFSLPDDIIYEILASFPQFTGMTKRIHYEDIEDLIDLAETKFEKEPILINVPSNINVVGDIHGNITDLLRIFEKIGYPPENKFLFLGDYVDRGNNSLEVICLLLALKVQYPDSIYLLRGNHETKAICSSYGFLYEIIRKYNDGLFNKFIKLFSKLPIAAVVGNKILCVHGGISENMKTLDELKEKEKPGDFIGYGIVSDILWSDPLYSAPGFIPNSRGSGCFFNEEVLKKFLDDNNLIKLIRSHELCYEGYDYPFGPSDSCITVFSNTDYCGRGNFAAVAFIDNENKVTTTIFNPLKPNAKDEMHITLPQWLLDERAKRITKKQVEDISSTNSPTSSPLTAESIYMLE